jgi:hypothetical protein
VFDSYAKYIQPRGDALDTLLGNKLMSDYVAEKLQTVIALDAYGVSQDINLEQLADVMLGIAANSSIITDDDLRAQFRLLDKLAQYINQFNTLAGIIKSVYGTPRQSDVNTPIVEFPFTLEECIKLDAYFGPGSVPWLEFEPNGTPGDLTVLSAENLSIVVQSIKDMLGSVKRESLSGLPSGSGLYLQRYKYLNNRMQRGSGKLAIAGLLEENWRSLMSQQQHAWEMVEAYKNKINVLPIMQKETLVYLDPYETFEGNYYYQEAIDAAKQAYQDMENVLCSPYPGQGCLEITEEEWIRTAVPPATTLNLYLKDNELELIHHNGRLPLQNSNGEYLINNNLHKVYSEHVFDPNEVRDLDDLRATVRSKVPNYEAIETLDWITGGRYGTLGLLNPTADPTDPNSYSYLYDALFLRDIDSAFKYGPSSKEYGVVLTLPDSSGTPDVYSGNIRLKVPIGLNIFNEAFSTGLDYRVYIASSSKNPHTGKELPPVYLNVLSALAYDFDIDEDDPAMLDIAQYIANQYKELDPTLDKYWMPRIRKLTTSARGVTTVSYIPGRPRMSDVIEPIIDVDAPINQADTLRGKPAVKMYTNFIRKIRFSMDTILWSESGKKEDIDQAKINYQYMTQDLHLVLVNDKDL